METPSEDLEELSSCGKLKSLFRTGGNNRADRALERSCLSYIMEDTN